MTNINEAQLKNECVCPYCDSLADIDLDYCFKCKEYGMNKTKWHEYQYDDHTYIHLGLTHSGKEVEVTDVRVIVYIGNLDWDITAAFDEGSASQKRQLESFKTWALEKYIDQEMALKETANIEEYQDR